MSILPEWVSRLTAGEMVAGYAAIVSTCVAMFELWKWFKSGRRLKLRLEPFRSSRSAMGVHDFSITNVGSEAVTITGFSLDTRNGYWPDPDVESQSELPCKLMPSERFTGSIRSRNPREVCWLTVFCSHSQWPYKLRLPKPHPT